MLETECLPQACFTQSRLVELYGENSLGDEAHPWEAYSQPLAPIGSVFPDPPEGKPPSCFPTTLMSAALPGPPVTMDLSPLKLR